MPVSAASPSRPGLFSPSRAPSSPPARDASSGGEPLSGPAPARGPDRFEVVPDRRLAERDATAVAAVHARSTAPAGGLEFFLQMPDAQTVPVSVEMRDIAKRWWIPGALVPDVLQRTGWHPRAFFHHPVPEQVGPNLYRVQVKRSWFARLCGAELMPDPWVHTLRLERAEAGGVSHAAVTLAPDLRSSSASSTCALPAGATGSEYEPLRCTAAIAGARGASSTLQIEWPR